MSPHFYLFLFSLTLSVCSQQNHRLSLRSTAQISQSIFAFILFTPVKFLSPTPILSLTAVVLMGFLVFFRLVGLLCV